MVYDKNLIEKCLVVLAFSNLTEEVKNFEESFNVELDINTTADEMLEVIQQYDGHEKHMLYTHLVVISGYELETCQTVVNELSK